MVWRCRNSAAANRRALHSDYTSATKKTPTPLNGRCTQPQNPSCFASTRPLVDSVRDAHACGRSARLRKFSDPSRSLMKSAFSRISRNRIRFHAHDETCSRRMHPTSPNAATVSLLPRSKIFSTDALFEPPRGGGFDQKRANRAQSDSSRCARRRRLGTRPSEFPSSRTCKLFAVARSRVQRIKFRACS